MDREREKWVDYIRLFACVLVAVGHFWMSMVTSGIMKENDVYDWFIDTIYYFHVPLFFVCSGYLYQKLVYIESVNDWILHSIKKLMALGVPYVVFQTITWLLKTIFASSVNGETDLLIVNLIYKPLNQFWYLYALFFVFIFTPKFIKKSYFIGWIVMTIVMKIMIVCTGAFFMMPLPIRYYLGNEIWFVLGMAIQYFNIHNRCIGKKWMATAGMGVIVFLVLSILIQVYDCNFKFQSAVMCFLMCISTVLLAINIDSNGFIVTHLYWLSRYTLPIYLMHTIFAASFRAVLLKLGVSNLLIHTIVGISVSFVGPIIVMVIAKKIKFIDFIVYPTKYIKMERLKAREK